MSDSQYTQIFNRNSVSDLNVLSLNTVYCVVIVIYIFGNLKVDDVDDSDLVNSYDKQYEKVKKKAKAKLPPIDSMSELCLNDGVIIFI